MRRFQRLVRELAADERGVAAIEAGLVGTMLIAALLNVIEVSRYAYVSTQVSAASQAAAQAAVIACDPTHSPVTSNCPALNDAVATAIHGTSLGEQISLGDTLSEAWYCISVSDTLQKVSGAGDTCSGGAGTKPALYLQIRTTYTYDPMFPGLTIAATFPETIEHTAWMRTL